MEVPQESDKLILFEVWYFLNLSVSCCSQDDVNNTTTSQLITLCESECLVMGSILTSYCFCFLYLLICLFSWWVLLFFIAMISIWKTIKIYFTSFYNRVIFNLFSLITVYLSSVLPYTNIYGLLMIRFIMFQYEKATFVTFCAVPSFIES